ncbi:Uncharacterised protein [Weissella viridescens]|uniref:Uncharacterized protein n=1 Tax=Weissella viridescens TaxID=1629 RepID=A0A380NXU0_WEIVI|nr:Uncharacterised protein [Weissella viridescens]
MSNTILNRSKSVLTTTFEGLIHAFSPKYEAKEVNQFTKIDWLLLTIMLVAQVAVFYSAHDYSTGAIISLIAGLTMVVSLILLIRDF